MPRTDTFVHLVGVSRPNPWKKSLFHSVDLTALQASVKAAVRKKVRHFVFVSVAGPAPVMREYQAVRSVCEMIIADAGLNATILKPWYVVGPGHWWPSVLLPVYKVAEIVPWTRDAALRLGLLTREEMIRALVWAVENPLVGIRRLDVRAIRAISDRALVPEASEKSVTEV